MSDGKMKCVLYLSSGANVSADLNCSIDSLIENLSSVSFITIDGNAAKTIVRCSSVCAVQVEEDPQ